MYSKFKTIVLDLEKQGFKFQNSPSKWHRRRNMKECAATKHGIGCYLVRIWEDLEEKEWSIEIFKLEKLTSF